MQLFTAVILFVLVQIGYGLQNDKSNTSVHKIVEQDATARSNILILQREEEEADSPANGNHAASRQNVAAVEDKEEGEEDEEESSSTSAETEKTHYIPTQQVLRNISAFVFGEGFVTDPKRVTAQLQNRSSEETEENESDEDEGASLSEHSLDANHHASQSQNITEEDKEKTDQITESAFLAGQHSAAMSINSKNVSQLQNKTSEIHDQEDDEEGEDEDEDTETAYPSEHHATSPGAKNVHNISLSAATYQSLTGNSKSPRLGNRTANAPSLNYPNVNQTVYATNMNTIKTPRFNGANVVAPQKMQNMQQQHTVQQRQPNTVSAAPQNVNKQPQNTAYKQPNTKINKPINNYKILTSDSQNKTKKINMNDKNNSSQKNSHQNANLKPLQTPIKISPPKNTSQLLLSTGNYSLKNASLAGFGNGPTYGPWKTIDVSNAMLQQASQNTTVGTSEKSQAKPHSLVKGEVSAIQSAGKVSPEKSKNSAKKEQQVMRSTGKDSAAKSKTSIKGEDQATLMLKLGKKGVEKKKSKSKKANSKKHKKIKKGNKQKKKKTAKKNHAKKVGKKNISKKKVKKFKSKDLKKIPENDYKETGKKGNDSSSSNEKEKEKENKNENEKQSNNNDKDNNTKSDENKNSKEDGKLKISNKTIEIDNPENKKPNANKQSDNSTNGESKKVGNEPEKGAKQNDQNGSASNEDEKSQGGKPSSNETDTKEDSNKPEKSAKQNDGPTLINKNQNSNGGGNSTVDENEGKINVKEASEKENKKEEEAIKIANEGKPTVAEGNSLTQQNVDSSELKEEPKKKQDEKTKELQETLSKLRFNNGAPGKVHTGQQFSYISQCGLYTEPQNVSQPQHSWVTKTYSPYFYLYEKPKDYEKCKPSDWMYGKDMRGGVFLNFEVKSLHGSNLTNNAKICEKYCCKEPRCEAWVVRFQESASNNCPEKSFCCWLKNEVPPIEDYYLESASIAGLVHRKHYRHPPTGMRSAVPLGGLGAGSFEMRADGTFHEWTIENQSPGGSAKLGKTALEKMFLGVRVKHGEDKAKSAILKTHSLHGFENETIKSLEYFGAHPVSKFAIELSDAYKDKVGLNMYAFSPFHPRDPIESATPAVSFTLEVTNLSPNEESEVSFMLNIPFGYNEDTVRKGGNYQEAEFSRLVTPSDCQRECAKRAECQSWTTNGPHTCMLKDTIPLHSYDFGIVSGIRGDWTVKDGVLNCQRPGFSPQSGDISMYPLQSGSEDMAFMVTDDVENAWNNFKKFGHVSGNASHTIKLNQTGLHGSVSLGTKLQPKETKLLSIVFSWYFPNKDIADERVGNFYNNLFKDSVEVAKHFEEDLVGSAADILKWHSAVFTPPTVKSDGGNIDEDEDSSTMNEKSHNCSSKVNGVATLPTCLQDVLVNSLSFLRTAMWFENGRWRQWEAFDCANLDPVHIDFHRIIPYMIFYPDLVKQIMFSWADHQMSNLENGMIQESLSQGCLDDTSREGSAGGRQMTDVNVAFITQAYLVYSWTNDTDFFNQIYPYTVRAMHWLIHRSTKNSGLPHRRPDAYDLFELEKYDHSAYNSIMYILSLRVMTKMARIQKDNKVLGDVGRALDRAEQLFDVEMWDEKKGFYHAWFDDEWGSPNWLMSDIFYGQVWSYTLGIGDLVDKDKIKRHLKKEGKRNDSPYGLKVITKTDEPIEVEDTSIILGDESSSCKSLENVTKTNSIWMSSSSDWSTLQLHLGMTPDKAMEQAIKSLDNYRSTLRDQWNFHGITSSDHYGLDGLPWATSHYTLHLVLWHLPLALSGQHYYAPEGKISFNPKYSPPYWLPFYTPFCMGNIEAKEKTEGDKNVEIEYTVNVSSGRCKFNELSISKSKYDSPVDLNEGESLSWSTPKLSQADRIKSMLDLLKKH